MYFWFFHVVYVFCNRDMHYIWPLSHIREPIYPKPIPFFRFLKLGFEWTEYPKIPEIFGKKWKNGFEPVIPNTTHEWWYVIVLFIRISKNLIVWRCASTWLLCVRFLSGTFWYNSRNLSRSIFRAHSSYYILWSRYLS